MRVTRCESPFFWVVSLVESTAILNTNLSLTGNYMESSRRRLAASAYSYMYRFAFTGVVGLLCRLRRVIYAGHIRRQRLSRDWRFWRRRPWLASPPAARP